MEPAFHSHSPKPARASKLPPAHQCCCMEMKEQRAAIVKFEKIRKNCEKIRKSRRSRRCHEGNQAGWIGGREREDCLGVQVACIAPSAEASAWARSWVPDAWKVGPSDVAPTSHGGMSWATSDRDWTRKNMLSWIPLDPLDKFY